MFVVKNKEIFRRFNNLISNTFNHKENSNNEDGYIYIDMLRAVFLGNFFSKLLYAKGVQDSGLNYKIIILAPTPAHEENQLKMLADAFNAELVDTRDLSNIFYSVLQTLYWFLCFGRKNRIFDIKIGGEKLGQYL